MEKQIGFGIVIAAFVVGFIAGPVRHLWTGEIRYRQYKSDEWYGWKRRSHDPGKFYAHVALETVVLLLLLGMAYWMMFHLKARG
jgi:hypothetical protein